MQNYPIATKSVTPSVTNAWASVAASTSLSYQLVGFSGAGSTHAAAVTVSFGSTEKLRYVGACAKSGTAISEFFGLDGPITATNEGIVVRVQTIPGGTQCYANLIYRKVIL